MIVPVHDCENYLRKCIESCLGQSYPNIELLLINDGSSDKSGGICENYAKQDCRVKVFHQENMGVSRARNLGLSNFSGDFACFVDADDWIEERYIEALVVPMLGNPQIDISMSNFAVEFLDGTTRATRSACQSGIYRKKQSQYEIFFSATPEGWTYHGKLFRARLLGRFSCHERYVIGKDAADTWELLKRCHILHYSNELGNRSMYHYLQQPNGVSANVNLFGTLGSIEVFRRLHDDCPYRKEMKWKILEAYQEVARALAAPDFPVEEHRRIKEFFLESYRNNKDKLPDFIDSIPDLSVRHYFHSCLMQGAEDFLGHYSLALDKIRMHFGRRYIYGTGRTAVKLAAILEKSQIPFAGYLLSDNREKEPSPDARHAVSYVSEALRGDRQEVLILVSMKIGNLLQVLPRLSCEGTDVLIW